MLIVKDLSNGKEFLINTLSKKKIIELWEAKAIEPDRYLESYQADQAVGTKGDYISLREWYDRLGLNLNSTEITTHGLQMAYEYRRKYGRDPVKRLSSATAGGTNSAHYYTESDRDIFYIALEKTRVDALDYFSTSSRKTKVLSYEEIPDVEGSFVFKGSEIVFRSFEGEIYEVPESRKDEAIRIMQKPALASVYLARFQIEDPGKAIERTEEKQGVFDFRLAEES